MRLTAAQIEDADHFVRDSQTFTGLQVNGDVLRPLRTALAAYERVAALLASKSEAGCFGLLTERTISCSELARALYGDAADKAPTVADEKLERDMEDYGPEVGSDR